MNRCFHCRKPIAEEPWLATDGTRRGDCCLKHLLVQSLPPKTTPARPTPAEQAIGGTVIEMSGATSRAMREAKKR